MTRPADRDPGRVDLLENAFGDLHDAGNPLGWTAILEADEQAEVFRAGERVLDAYRLNAEFVPVAEGGRLARIDTLAEVMRVVYRRDPALGLGYGVSSLISGVNVWAAGDAAQRRQVAGLLLGNGKVACAFHELAHGNDMAGMSLAARPDGDRLLLDGRKEVITNLQRSDAVVVLARTRDRAGSRNHSVVLLDKSAVPDGAIRYLPRYPSVGMRGVQLGGFELRDCPVPAGQVLGGLGRGLETALRAFQITRTTLVGMMTGILDSGLRITLRHLSTRRLYRGAATDLPYLREVLADTFVDLLICEAYTTVAARALHVLPGEASLYSSAVKFFVSKRLMDAMHRLSTALGAHFYLREGDHALFQKLLRDLRPAGFAHIARAVCQMSLLPQLPAAARRAWGRAGTASDMLFRLGDDLPDFKFDQLTVSAQGRDTLLPALPALTGAPELAPLGAGFAGRLTDLTSHCADLGHADLTARASAAAYDLAAEYSTLLAAATCAGVWRHAAAGGDPLLADPAWLVAALHRLPPPGVRPSPVPAWARDRLLTDLFARHDDVRSFGLSRRPLPGSG